MLLVLTVVLVALAALNAIFTAWATVLDARQCIGAGARARRDPAAGQRRAVGGAGAARAAGRPRSASRWASGCSRPRTAGTVTVPPPAWWLAAAVLGTLLAVAGLTTIPARIGARRPGRDPAGRNGLMHAEAMAAGP